ncbi:phosphatidate cytidylyltransferase [Thecamonas trahens ATCC 50062]|uniref:Phosphatidate cytidylyltransferase n=1 Tax=Thecamonas trahens ATCC 50062 TaxID=461836 RepID=A0A0L0DFD7_THETB|nr:phosphatidate cytidylyltransferase [Thecamonas trahens ATCC 50062]KNC50028.1 phosphatidate cytidylyltransferase [Thecamonas trahens ATCC 50062]|eukprot:XP_013757195.1 phosphatidate cytidylyltransferase [Thecamonas trahens ATCC 50062]
MGATQRLATAAVVLPPLVLALASPTWVVVLVAAAVAGAVLELLALLAPHRVLPMPEPASTGAAEEALAAWPTAGLASLVVVAVWAYDMAAGAAAVALAVAVVLVRAASAWAAPPRTGSRARMHILVSALVHVLALVYVALPLAVATRLPRLGVPGAPAADPATTTGVVVLFAAWNVDNGGLVGGNIAWPWAKHPLAPRLSPKKSWEGVIVGGLLSLASPLLLGLLADATWPDAYPRAFRLPALHHLPLGVLTTLAMVCGDLVESFLKRAVGVKDSSSIFPGHGGVLDKIDGLLFALPAAYGMLLLLGHREV